MGDGRYYTFNQFITTIILVFLIIFITVILALSYFKKTNQKGDKFLILSLVLFDFIAIFRFVEILYMNQVANETFRFIQIALLLLSYTSFICYLLSEFGSHKFNKKNIGISIVILASTLLTLVFIVDQFFKNENLFILYYASKFTLYSLLYAIMVSCELLLITYILIKIYVKARKNKAVDKIRIGFTVIGVMCLLPLIVYVLSLHKGYLYNDEIEIIIVFLGTVALNMLLNLKVSYGITPFAFDKLKGIMGNFVFVTDNNDKIVFKNDYAVESLLFSDSSTLNIKSLECIFNNKIIQKNNQLGINYIEMQMNSRTNYFLYRHSTLMSKSSKIGKIITFIDITELIELLNELKLQQTKMSRKNKELMEYKKIVYDIEKENEINSLLEDIIIVQEKNMKQVIGKIDQCSLKMDDELFPQYLDEIIELLEKNLGSVRKAVNLYSKHYGGKK